MYIHKHTTLSVCRQDKKMLYSKWLYEKLIINKNVDLMIISLCINVKNSAYEVCPQGLTENEASQVMKIVVDRNLSQLKLCFEVTHSFMLSEVDKNLLCQGQFRNPFSTWGLICKVIAVH